MAVLQLSVGNLRRVPAFDTVSVVVMGVNVTLASAAAHDSTVMISSDAHAGPVLDTVVEHVCKVSTGFTRCCKTIRCLLA